MGTITIRNLDDEIIERLKTRARIHRRSLRAELLEILISATKWSPLLDPVAEADRIAAMTPKGVRQTDSVILLRGDRDR